MADTDYLDHQAVINDFIDDAVVTDSDPVYGVLVGESDAAWGTGLVGQQVHRCANAQLLSAWQARDRFHGSARDLDLVLAHPSPSAALTSSQGT